MLDDSDKLIFIFDRTMIVIHAQWYSFFYVVFVHYLRLKFFGTLLNPSELKFLSVVQVDEWTGGSSVFAQVRPLDSARVNAFTWNVLTISTHLSSPLS